MPLDTHRIAGPEETQNAYSFIPETDLNRLRNLSAVERVDGRGPENVRSVFLKAGVISQAKGSAYIELNKTKAICAVYGPREVIRKEDFSMKGQLTCDFKFATFSCKFRRQHQQDSEEKDFSVLLLEALEPAVCLNKFPKAQLNLYLTVLEDDGSVLSAAIMCASAAIADAGVEMYDLVTSCSARLCGECVLLDPCGQEEYKPDNCEECPGNQNGNLTVGYMPSLNQLSTLASVGEANIDTISKAIKQCINTCHQLYTVQQDCLTKSVTEKQAMLNT